MFEVLTGHRPWLPTSLTAYAAAIEAAEAPDVRTLDATVPPELARIAAKALAREPGARYSSVDELSRAIRDWEEATVLERELVARRTQAEDALADAEQLSGRALDVALDRATSCVARVLERRPDDGPAAALAERIARQRDRAVREREAASARRVLRRALVAVLVLATVTAAVVATLLEDRRREAESARRRADVEHAKAEGLVDFMLTDLRRNLEPIGRQDLLARIARAARDHYAGAPIEGAGDEERARRAVAWEALGQVFQAQGDLPSALGAFQAAADLTAAIAARAPDDVERAHQATLALARTAEIADAQGRRKEALDAYRGHLADLEALARRAPADAALAVSLAKAHGLLGNSLVRQNDLDGALAQQQASERIAGGAVERGTDQAEARDAWLAATTRVGQMHVFRGEFAEALAAQGRAIERAEAYSRAEPGDDRWRRRVVEARLGSIAPLAKTGDLAAAQRTYEEVRRALERDRAADPANERWPELLAVLEARLADVLIPLRRHEEALVHARAGLAIAEPLAARDETNAKRLHLVVDLADRASAALWAMQRKEEAAVERRKTVTASERLLARDPSNPTWRQMLGFNVRRLSEVERGMGRDRASLEAAERARSLLDPLSREFPDDAAVVIDAAFVEWEIALARYRLGEREVARSALRAALERVESVSRRWPPNGYGGVLLTTARTLDPERRRTGPKRCGGWTSSRRCWTRVPSARRTNRGCRTSETSGVHDEPRSRPFLRRLRQDVRFRVELRRPCNPAERFRTGEVPDVRHTPRSLPMNPARMRPSTLFSLALSLFLCVALGACGGGSEAGVDGQHTGQVGTITVTNGTDFFWATCVLSGANGSATVSNVGVGGQAIFTNVAYGAFSVNAYGAAGQHLAGGSGTLSQPNLSTSLN